MFSEQSEQDSYQVQIADSNWMFIFCETEPD